MEREQKRRIGKTWYTDARYASTRIALLLMTASAIIRTVYFAVRAVPPSMTEWIVHLLLPIGAAAVFDVVILRYARTHLHLTCVSVWMGVLFFAWKAFSFESRLHTILCLFLYTAVLVLYTMVVLFGIGPKELLYLLFGLPLLYHIFVEDLQEYILADPRPPFLEWLPEISVLCIMGALLALSVALERRDGGEGRI
ncbi:MAG: hypothetical protein IJC98_04105 [Clostridia bacterium]|nr:hypothetical protein [Clostridia bacterium]